MPSRTSARTRPGPADHDGIRLAATPRQEVSELLAGYTPRPAARQEALQFAASVLRILVFPSSDVQLKVLTMLVRFAQWCWLVGIDLDFESVFTASTIRRWIVTVGGDWRQERRWRYARRLSRIGTLLTGAPINVLIPHQHSEADPYRKTDLPWIHSWVATQHRPRQKIAAAAVVGLCGGAGLTNREVAGLKVGDLVEAGDLVRVRVPGREVVVAEGWARFARDVLEASTHTDGYLLSPNWTSNRGQMIRPHAGAETRWPRPHRLRNTWILGALATRPLPEALAAAGVTSIAGILRHEPFLTDPDIVAEFVTMYPVHRSTHSGIVPRIGQV